MAQYTPDSTLLEVLDKGEGGEEQQNSDGTLQREGDCGGTGNTQGNGCGRPPFHVRGHGAMGGPSGAHGCSSIGEYDLDTPGQPNILNHLVAALQDASLEGKTLSAIKGADQMQDTQVGEILVELKMTILTKKKKMMHPESKYPLPYSKDSPESDLTCIF